MSQSNKEQVREVVKRIRQHVHECEKCIDIFEYEFPQKKEINWDCRIIIALMREYGMPDITFNVGDSKISLAGTQK